MSSVKVGRRGVVSGLVGVILAGELFDVGVAILEVFKGIGVIVARMFGGYMPCNKIIRESDGTVLNELELTQLQLKADRMPQLFDEFAEIQRQIECLSDKVEQFEERVEFENAHDLNVARIKSLLGKLDD
nr:unnamed protein product [Callosobruchus analis]